MCEPSEQLSRIGECCLLKVYTKELVFVVRGRCYRNFVGQILYPTAQFGKEVAFLIYSVVISHAYDEGTPAILLLCRSSDRVVGCQILPLRYVNKHEPFTCGLMRYHASLMPCGIYRCYRRICTRKRNAPFQLRQTHLVTYSPA